MPLGYIFSPIFTLDSEMGSHEAAHAGLGFTLWFRPWLYNPTSASTEAGITTHTTQTNIDLFRERWDLRTEKSQIRKGVVRRPLLVTEKGGLV